MPAQTKKEYKFDLLGNLPNLEKALLEIALVDNLDTKTFQKIVKKHPRKDGGLFSKYQLLEGLKKLKTEKPDKFSQNFESLAQKIQMKPMRTQSGVATVTVLTKPFPCPGKCIFCPNDVRMPKSYLHDEPGAQRAARNKFQPYLQTYRRLQALKAIGHPTDKIELIILGGTWSFYPEKYQIWFINECFKALNDFEATNPNSKIDDIEKSLKNWKYLDKAYKLDHVSEKLINRETYNQKIQDIYKNSQTNLLDIKESATWQELEKSQKVNETAKTRCVGLVIETRPDNISEVEVMRIRRLGCTKTQIGVQSLDDEVLNLNKRGHLTADTRRAFALLRQAGFKIHAHWMANLYGSNPTKDIQDYQKLFTDPDFCPDELKIYPCSLIESAELMEYYEKGLWQPYSHSELLEVVMECLAQTPEYCRLTRVIRDIPSTDIVVGNKFTNFRQLAEKEAENRGLKIQDIRYREIRNQALQPQELDLRIISYKTQIGVEKFLQFVTKENKIAGFLRLSLPSYQTHPFCQELDFAAIIREIHIYGKVLNLGKSQTGRAQHYGLGKKLIQQAIALSTEQNYQKLAVISAIGTREYYRKRGFKDGELYQYYEL